MKKSKFALLTTILMLVLTVFISILKKKDSIFTDLTTEEKNWLENNQIITFVSQSSYPPFEFVDEQGQNQGMCLELASWIATEYGFKTKFINMSFKEAQEALLEGKADVLTSLFYSEERNKKFDFNTVMWKVPASIFVEFNRPDIVTIDDLEGKKVAIQNGDYAIDYLESKKIAYTLISCSSFAEATNLLANGEVDAVIGDDQIIEYYIYTNNYTEKIKKAGSPLYSGSNCMAVKEGNRLLGSIINKGVKRAIEKGIIENINKKWLGTVYTFSGNWLEKNLDSILTALVVLILMIALVVLWNFQLQKKVGEKTAELEKLLQEKNSVQEELIKESKKLSESKENLRITLLSIADGVISADLEGKIIQMNHVAEKITGWSFQEAKNADLLEVYKVVDPLTNKQIAKPFKQVVEEATIKSMIRLDRILVSKNGDEYRISAAVAPVRGNNKEVAGIVISFRDTSKEYELNKEIKESSEKFKSLFENNPVAICLEDFAFMKPEFEKLRNEGISNLEMYIKDNPQFSLEIAKKIKILDVNKAVLTMFEASSKQEYIKNVAATFTKQAFSVFEAELVDLWQGKTHTSYETTFTTLKGDIRHAVLDSRIIKGFEEDFSRVLLSIKDITARKQSEIAVQESKRLGAIGEMATSVAHDFNNSLQAIFGNLEIALMQNDITENIKEYLLSMKKAALDASTRVQLLQRFGGKKKNRSTYTFTNLNNLVNDVIIQTRPMWKDKMEKEGKVVSIKTDFKDNFQVSGNSSELRTVLYNIIKNSLESMVDGGEILISTHKTSNWLELEIKDSGAGMDEKTKSRIFQPFYSTKGYELGRGLGMSASYSIIKEHGGEIFVKESVLGKGTTIVIRFPFVSQDAFVNSEKMVDIKVPDRKMKILWVDDEAMIRDISRKFVEILGHIPIIAENGAEALNLLKTEKPDLVITDIGMPDMNGWQLTESIRKLYKDRLPIAVVTGWGTEYEEDEIKEKGADFIIGKPLKLEDFKDLLQKIS